MVTIVILLNISQVMVNPFINSLYRYQYLYDTDPREEMKQIGSRGIIFNYSGFIPQMVWDQ